MRDGTAETTVVVSNVSVSGAVVALALASELAGGPDGDGGLRLQPVLTTAMRPCGAPAGGVPVPEF